MRGTLEERWRKTQKNYRNIRETLKKHWRNTTDTLEETPKERLK